jgi:hypothetical protein
MPMGSYREQRNKQAARPVPSVAELRSRVIKKLLLIVEGDERPEAVVSASRVLLDLPTARELPATVTQSSEEARRIASRLVAEAFAEVMQRRPPLLEPPAVAPITEAIPEPTAEGNGKAEAAGVHAVGSTR